ncbi:tetratricopeptide (TPR) repeat protein [Neisseria perflava]|uniref:tetratricopeptide repeat-containing glycosyltransferase family protein n=1 Tax=Neisseria perflava TaxID=33053 RepID=UPI00209F3266|nr:tetratricopeptide repeat-containing glycosyltransferase family protein [Neisseria perflava]MCP1772202.1 tetratricopeptide (TPR) repeat protein [Neisseria perflava]
MNTEELRQYFAQTEQLLIQNRYEEAAALLQQLAPHCTGHPKFLTLNANALLQAGRLDEAEADLRQALKAAPEDSEIYFQLGQLFKKRHNPHVAAGYFHKAYKLNPTRNTHLFYLAAREAVAETREDFLALKAMFDGYIAQYPQDFSGYFHRGRILGELGLHQESLADLARSAELDPENHLAWVRKALQMLLLEQYEEGWATYERRLQMGTSSVGSPVPDLPRWPQNELGDDKTLLIYTEQGFGDNIQFLRYAFEAQKRGMKVTVCNAQPLQRLLGYNLARYGISSVQSGDQLSKNDYCQVSMMSLPHYFHTTVDSIPNPGAYLEAEPEYQKKWRIKIPVSHKPKIGIAWAGSKTNARDHQRSVGLSTIMPLFAADADFHCLQKDITPHDRVRAAKIPNLSLWDKDLADFSDTAGLLSKMDLIITIDSSVAHLAAAMGKPTWLMITYLPDFRWLLKREDSVWYDSLRLFRQDETLSWQPVVEKVQTALAEFMAEKHG